MFLRHEFYVDVFTLKTFILLRQLMFMLPREHVELGFIALQDFNSYAKNAYIWEKSI